MLDSEGTLLNQAFRQQQLRMQLLELEQRPVFCLQFQVRVLQKLM